MAAAARQQQLCSMNFLDPVERRKEQNRNAQRKYRKSMFDNIFQVAPIWYYESVLICIELLGQKETAQAASGELSISTENKRTKTSQQIQKDSTPQKQYDQHIAYMLHSETHHDQINDDILAPELEIWKASHNAVQHMLDEDQLLEKNFDFDSFNTSAAILSEAYPISSSEVRPEQDQEQDHEKEQNLAHPSNPPQQNDNCSSAPSQNLVAHRSASRSNGNQMFAASEADICQQDSPIQETSSNPRANSTGVRQVEEGTALHFAALHGQTSVVKMLLNRGAHHSLQNRNGERPLHLAVQARHILIVRLLLSHGADINARGAGGGTALHLAVKNEDQSMVTLLIGSEGIDIDARDGKNRTPLHVAVEKGYESILGMLRRANADIDSRRDDGLTALHHAIVGDRAEIVSMLLDHGANQEAESVLMREHA